MPSMRLWIQKEKGDRKWYTPVVDEGEAYSAVRDERIPTLEEMEEGLTFRRIHDFGLEISQDGESWETWIGDEGESFQDFCENLDWEMSQETAEDQYWVDENYPS